MYILLIHILNFMFEWSTNDALTYKHVTNVAVRTVLWYVDKLVSGFHRVLW
jgi:hypothetical protein